MRQINSLQEDAQNPRNPRLTVNGSTPIKISDTNDTLDWQANAKKAQSGNVSLESLKTMVREMSDLLTVKNNQIQQSETDKINMQTEFTNQIGLINEEFAKINIQAMNDAHEAEDKISHLEE